MGVLRVGIAPFGGRVVAHAYDQSCKSYVIMLPSAGGD